jgi:hypothetical protein
MGATWKKYDATYKKRVDIDRDTYLPTRSPKEVIQCAGCGAFYHRRRWALTAPAGFILSIHAQPKYCAACAKIKDRRASGELYLIGLRASDRGEVLRILRNEEGRAREKNPLERIMQVQAPNGDLKVQTTTEKLAQRLGRAVKTTTNSCGSFGKVPPRWLRLGTCYRETPM